MNKFLYWLPRVLAILITAFFYMFVLEGFMPGFGWADALAHFVLATVVLLVTILAWKKPKVGGFVFAIVGIRFLIPAVFRTPSLDSLIIGGIPLLTGILFIIEGFRKKAQTY